MKRLFIAFSMVGLVFIAAEINTQLRMSKGAWVVLDYKNPERHVVSHRHSETMHGAYNCPVTDMMKHNPSQSCYSLGAGVDYTGMELGEALAVEPSLFQSWLNSRSN